MHRVPMGHVECILMMWNRKVQQHQQRPDNLNKMRPRGGVPLKRQKGIPVNWMAPKLT